MIRYEKRKIDEIEPNPNNPRRISKAARKALATSMRRFGLVQPVVINERTGRVVGGHQRLAVLREQGVVEIDVAIGSWTDAEERVLNVALNNPNGQGEFTDVRAFLDDALSALSLDDFHELQFDELVFDPPNTKRERYIESMTEVEAVDTAAIVGSQFEIIVRGDINHQADVIERLKSLPEGVIVRVGLAKNQSG